MAKAKHQKQSKHQVRAIPTAPNVATRASEPPEYTLFSNSNVKPALLSLLLIGFLLRVVNLDALSLWVDEFVHVLPAKKFTEGTGSLMTKDNNGILLTFTMLPFVKLFGATAFWARLPSVLFGVGSIYLLYRIGTRMFNRYVGFLAAFASTFSLYLIFWSRIARNYAIFGFFFLLLAWVFLQAFEKTKDPNYSGFWKKNGLSSKYSLLLMPVLAGALLSHQLTFFFGFSVSMYAIIVAAQKFISRSEDRFNNKYLWLGALSLPLLILAMPGVNDILRAPLSIMLSKEQVDWVLPQASRLSELWSKEPWTAFNVYHNILRYDLRLLYFPALAGLLAAYKVQPRSGAWLTAIAVIPFLLMSFLFREPALPRYFIFVFPWALLSAAVFFYFSYQLLTQKIWPNASRPVKYALLLFPLLFMIGSARWTELKEFVLAEQREGHVVNNNISNLNFTNWRQPCDFISRNKKPGDILLSTVPTAASFYLNNDNVLWFRQMKYDTNKKKYVPNPQQGGMAYSAATFEDFKRTVESAPRGWLLADYYFDNIFVDDRARLYTYANLHYYPEASPDGSVRLFGWDHSKPKPREQNMVVPLGKAADKVVSENFMIGIPSEVLQSPKVLMKIRYQDVNSNREALVIFNDENAVYLPPNQGDSIESQSIEVDKDWLEPGQNKVQLMYEEEVKYDPDKGFTVYYIDFDGE